jgi:glycine/D-amino acid oxidase-like deaminating enzyme
VIGAGDSLLNGAPLPRLSRIVMLSRLVGMNDPRAHRNRAVVVGGGPAGLIAAAKLANAGIATTLVEASSELGGRAASKRQSGFDLNQGAHALYVGGPGMRQLRSLGIDPERWNPVSHRSVFLRAGRARRSPGGAAALARWLGSLLRDGPARLQRISVNEWLARTLPDPSARAAAGALVRVTTFVADHDALSADVAAQQIRLGAAPGVRYVNGGWGRIVAALSMRARRRGATIRTRAGVRALEPIGDGGWSVVLDDELLLADAVVLAVGGPGACAQLLGERMPAPPGPAAEVSVLDLGLRSLPRRGRTFGLGIDEPTYISKHSPPGNPDGVLVSLVRYERGPRVALESVADIVQPGWRERLTFDRFLPRMIAVSAIPTPASGGLAGRPAIDRGDGLFIAGDWVGPDGWLLDAALSSGTAAASGAVAAVAAAAGNRRPAHGALSR